ncbi:integrase [Synergistales bacterium]|nr:integrase [Synergistales bacterium]
MLSDVAIRALKPKDKRYMERVDNGLYIQVETTGAKFWYYRGMKDGNVIKKSIGEYPHVSLSEARQQRDTFKAELAKGVNPVEREKAEQEAAKLEEERKSLTFEVVALEWYNEQVKGWVPTHAETVIYRMKHFIFPKIGDKPISELKTPEILALLKTIEITGKLDTTKKVKNIIGQVLRYGIAKGICAIDFTAGLRGQLVAPSRTKHYSAITKSSEIAELMRRIRGYNSFVVQRAMFFSAYTFQHPGEIRHAEWKEIDFDAALWRIPAAKMKMKRDHLVPLARQSIELLREIQELTGDRQYIFPSARNDGRPMSENTIRIALRSMGYGNDEMTAHGFRGMVSTQLNEQGYNADVIELCLAHAESNSVRAAYNHAERLDERRTMYQEWADWLDGLNAD